MINRVLGSRPTEPEVWCAAHGSNLDIARFRRYLEGGAPRSGTRAHRRCPYGAEILDAGRYATCHPLYFAGQSTQWDHGGVAFVGLAHGGEPRTLCSAYRLKVSRFWHVASEENGGHSVASLQATLMSDTIEVRNRGWYRVVLNLGSHGGLPVLTITGKPAEIGAHKAPAAANLDTIRITLLAGR